MQHGVLPPTSAAAMKKTSMEFSDNAPLFYSLIRLHEFIMEYH